jgi:fibronectin type 3 domain-containing protein
LSGTGVSVSYEVALSWSAPTDTTDPAVGYDIYRATGSSTSYQQLNSSANSSTSYADTTVANGSSYTYYVTSVDASGNQSAPSDTLTISVPTS